MSSVVETHSCHENFDQQHTFDENSVAYEFVRQYYTVLTEAPEHVWRFYAERAHYCCVHANGTRIVVTERSQLCDTITSPAVVVVSSVYAAQCSPNRFLIMATTDWFVQSFVVDFNPPSQSFSVVATIIVQHFSGATDDVYSITGSEERGGRVSCDGNCAKDCQCANRADDVGGTIAVGDRGNEYELVDVGDPKRDCREGDNSGAREKSCDSGKCGRGAMEYRNGNVRGTTDSQLFIGHLLSSTTVTDLRKTFGEYGNVVYVRILKGYNRTGNPANYNYAFVQFDGPKPVKTILANRPLKLCNGNRINVHRSKRNNNYYNTSDVVTR